MLKETFVNLCHKFTSNKQLANNLWCEIELNYSSPERYYHNLLHLQNLLAQLHLVADYISDWNVLMFSLYYHDIVYNVLRNDNEMKSAELARKNLLILDLPTSSIAACGDIILATNGHAASSDKDTNIFIDADLAILGSEPNDYHVYTARIRKEYSIFPDIVYKNGRMKVLEKLIAMERIYESEFFFDKLEQQARYNLHDELSKLGA